MEKAVGRNNQHTRKDEEIIGRRFGRLVVLSFDRVGHRSNKYYNCQCDCGKTVSKMAYLLRSGQTRSCGCYNSDLVTARKFVHGLGRTSEYSIWSKMKSRCYDTEDPGYKNYGGRGISMCDRWLNSFEAFYEDMYPRTSLNHTLDRINFDGNYEPTNCRWATRLEQANNTRRNIMIEYNGQTMSLSEWCRTLGLNYDKTRKKYHQKLSPSEILKP